MYTKRIILPICILIFLGLSNVFSQKTNKIKYDALGITFTVPEDWSGKKTEAGYLITSNSNTVFILILQNDIKDMITLKKDILTGTSNTNGTTLTQTGDISHLPKNGLASKYTGMMEWQKAYAFIACRLNPYGNGISVLCATKPNLYTDEHRKTTLQIANSIQFIKPNSDISIQNTDNEWISKLNDSRLTYMSTYSTYGGGGSSKRVIDLCRKGYFNFSSNYSMTLDTGGAFGSSSNANKGSGTWKVIKNALGESMLQLTFNNGKIYEYALTTDEDDKTFFNGNRYFRTYKDSGKYSPQCD